MSEGRQPYPLLSPWPEIAPKFMANDLRYRVVYCIRSLDFRYCTGALRVGMIAALLLGSNSVALLTNTRNIAHFQPKIGRITAANLDQVGQGRQSEEWTGQDLVKFRAWGCMMCRMKDSTWACVSKNRGVLKQWIRRRTIQESWDSLPVRTLSQKENSRSMDISDRVRILPVEKRSGKGGSALQAIGPAPST
ncbi:hypothetical protein BDN72DRAFT_878294 [Pluteus cervinus]|uniref:Uncharacterized protein n=1 Tax=Pluteus cervinus TaxID=181527 RepID=A0ACD3AWH1_9AGAR|nr:hypothetical protein BDN72DRAFT_878294 [Pluteus cervinus]